VTTITSDLPPLLSPGFQLCTMLRSADAVRLYNLGVLTSLVYERRRASIEKRVARGRRKDMLMTSVIVHTLTSNTLAGRGRPNR
jgi:hypothetical protein